MSNTNAALADFVARIERLEAEAETIKADIKQVFSELKADGFDPKIVKKVIALRKRDKGEIAEEQALLEQYMAALGHLADTPLGRAAIAAEFE